MHPDYCKLPFIGDDCIELLGGDPLVVWRRLESYLRRHCCTTIEPADGLPSFPAKLLLPSPEPLTRPDAQNLQAGDIVLLADCRLLEVTDNIEGRLASLPCSLAHLLTRSKNTVARDSVAYSGLRHLSKRVCLDRLSVTGLLKCELRVLTGPNNWQPKLGPQPLLEVKL